MRGRKPSSLILAPCDVPVLQRISRSRLEEVLVPPLPVEVVAKVQLTPLTRSKASSEVVSVIWPVVVPPAPEDAGSASVFWTIGPRPR